MDFSLPEVSVERGKVHLGGWNETLQERMDLPPLLQSLLCPPPTPPPPAMSGFGAIHSIIDLITESSKN